MMREHGETLGYLPFGSGMTRVVNNRTILLVDSDEIVVVRNIIRVG